MPTWCSRFSTSGFFRATLKKLGGGEHQLGTFLITLRCSPVVLVDMAHAPGLLQLWLDDGRSRCWVNEMPRPGRSKRRWRYAALGLGGGAQHVGLCLRASGRVPHAPGPAPGTVEHRGSDVLGASRIKGASRTSHDVQHQMLSMNVKEPLSRSALYSSSKDFSAQTRHILEIPKKHSACDTLAW